MVVFLAVGLFLVVGCVPPAEQPRSLDQVLYDDRAELLAARRCMDRTIEDFVATLDEAALAAPIRYGNMSGEHFTQPLWQLLAHVFNHQTHHRGQVHALLTGLGREAPPLDLIYFLREKG